MPPRRTHRIRSARALEALTSPVRQDLVDGLQTLGASSVTELAEWLGRAPDSLYYHLRKLEDAGLVRRAGTRGAGVREEVLYDTPGELVLDLEAEKPREQKSLLGVISAALRAGERDLRGALATGVARYRRTSRRNAWGSRTQGWLTADEVAEVREHLSAINELLLRGRPERGSALHSITFVLSPIASKRRTAAARAQARKPARKSR